MEDNGKIIVVRGQSLFFRRELKQFSQVSTLKVSSTSTENWNKQYFRSET